MKEVLIIILLILCWPGTGNVSFSQTPGRVPFGDFATPLEGETVRSSIAVTGWALDNTGTQDGQGVR